MKKTSISLLLLIITIFAYSQENYSVKVNGKYENTVRAGETAELEITSMKGNTKSYVLQFPEDINLLEGKSKSKNKSEALYIFQTANNLKNGDELKIRLIQKNYQGVEKFFTILWRCTYKYPLCVINTTFAFSMEVLCLGMMGFDWTSNTLEHYGSSRKFRKSEDIIKIHIN